MADGKEKLKTLQKAMHEQANPPKLTAKMGTVHEVMQGELTQ